MSNTVNYLLSLVGIKGPAWFAHPVSAMITLICADAWQQTPFVTLVFFAGLQAIPEEPVEASLVDGATTLQVVRYVVLPYLKPLMLFTLLMRGMDTFRIFDLVVVMTFGGPGSSTETLGFYNYITAFRQLDFGKGAAIGVLTLAMLSIIMGLLIYMLYSRERGEW